MVSLCLCIYSIHFIMPVYLLTSWYHACVSTRFMASSCMCIYSVYGIIMPVYLLSLLYRHACGVLTSKKKSLYWRGSHVLGTVSPLFILISCIQLLIFCGT